MAKTRLAVRILPPDSKVPSVPVTDKLSVAHEDREKLISSHVHGPMRRVLVEKLTSHNLVVHASKGVLDQKACEELLNEDELRAAGRWAVTSGHWSVSERLTDVFSVDDFAEAAVSEYLDEKNLLDYWGAIVKHLDCGGSFPLAVRVHTAKCPKHFLVRARFGAEVLAGKSKDSPWNSPWDNHGYPLSHNPWTVWLRQTEHELKLAEKQNYVKPTSTSWKHIKKYLAIRCSSAREAKNHVTSILARTGIRRLTIEMAQEAVSLVLQSAGQPDVRLLPLLLSPAETRKVIAPAAARAIATTSYPLLKRYGAIQGINNKTVAVLPEEDVQSLGVLGYIKLLCVFCFMRLNFAPANLPSGDKLRWLITSARLQDGKDDIPLDTIDKMTALADLLDVAEKNQVSIYKMFLSDRHEPNDKGLSAALALGNYSDINDVRRLCAAFSEMPSEWQKENAAWFCAGMAQSPSIGTAFSRWMLWMQPPPSWFFMHNGNGTVLPSAPLHCLR